MLNIVLTFISLIVAGSETTATLLSGCIYYLCTTPHAMARLTTEIRSAFMQDGDMTFRSLGNLEYLTAVIDEALRMYPPFVTSLTRRVPRGGALVNGQFVPENVCSRLSSGYTEKQELIHIDNCCVSSFCFISLRVKFPLP